MSCGWISIIFKRLFIRVILLKTFNFEVLFFGVLVFIFESLIIDLFFQVNWISVHWSWNLSSGVSQIVYGPYPNQTYVFASPTGFWKVVSRVPVGCSDLFASTDYFAWSKKSLHFLIKDFFCWFLTCVYCIYWVSVHWSWNLSSGVLENCLWKVSKS